jgi:rare lipoprotein A
MVTRKNSIPVYMFLTAGVWFMLTATQYPGDTIPKTPLAQNSHARPDLQTWRGTASVYSRIFHGRRTASGEIFDVNKISAAHKFLPLGTRVRIIHLKNQCSVELTINDRLPKTSPHIIDLSPEAARQIEIPARGIGKVRVERLAPSK